MAGANAAIWGMVAAAALLVAIGIALELPAYLLAVLFAEGAIVVFHTLGRHPYGIFVGLLFGALAAFFGLTNAGLLASASLVGSHP